MTFFIPGPAGKLQAELWRPGVDGDTGVPEGTPPRAAAVVCHPHPAYGGTMANTVVFRTARALRRAGAIVLRFNFRGVEESEGVSEGSEVEVEDARAALDYLEREFPELELWAGGFSFGARTASALARTEDRIARLVLVALPCAAFDCSPILDVNQPGLILMAENDEFGNLAGMKERFPDLHAGLELDEISATDHFFRHRTPQLEERVYTYATSALAQRS